MTTDDIKDKPIVNKFFSVLGLTVPILKQHKIKTIIEKVFKNNNPIRPECLNINDAIGLNSFIIVLVKK